MRRLALLGLLALLAGCDYASSPTVSFGSFIGDTHWINRNPNQAVGNAENMMRVTGRAVEVPPLTPEAGNIWPPPPAPEPTLEDLERAQSNGTEQPLGGGPGPSTPTPNLQVPAVPTPGVLIPAPHPQPRPQGSSSPPIPDLSVASPPPVPGPTTSQAPANTRGTRSNTYPTTQGPVQATPGANGVTTYQAPGGGIGIVVPNGNGTSTLVNPDGTVQTVPTPK